MTVVLFKDVLVPGKGNVKSQQHDASNYDVQRF